MPIDGLPLDAPKPPRDLPRAGLDQDPDAVAIRSADEQMTWRELDEAATRLASGYRSLGLAPGDRIASLMPNRVALAVHYLACFRAGLVATPLNYRYTATEIDHALAVSGATALVAHTERAEDVAASSASTLARGVISIGGDTDAGPSIETLLSTEPQPLDPVPDDAPAAIFFTSGSTGPSKGVAHSHESLGWMFASAAAGFELTEDDVFLPASSMSHIGSFMWLLAAFSVGAKVVVARTFDAHEVLPLLRAEQPTILAMIPAALTAMVRDPEASSEDFASLRLCRAGADKVSLELEDEFSHLVGFPIDEGYGMSEVGLATLNPPSGEIRRGSIGRPVPGVSISLRDDDGNEVPTGDVGRVWIRTRSHTPGYWENPEATAEILRDGWLDSGDLARADADGYLWFFGRKKQIIVHDGSNISPYEVEDALVGHPAVALAGVVGIHDETHGENVRAYVTLQEGVDPPSERELVAFAKERIGYKAPEEVVILDEMPLNPTGKLDRESLKRLTAEDLHPHIV